MSVRKSNKELFKMIRRMTLIGTLVVANVLFTMVSHKHLWSQKDVLDKRIASSIVEKTIIAKRGTIYDRNHTVIAQQTQSYTIVAYLDTGVIDANGNPNSVCDFPAFLADFIILINVFSFTLSPSTLFNFSAVDFISLT